VESGEERPPDAFEQAREAARSGRTEEALAILKQEMAQEGSGRGRFLRKSQIAQICMGAGRVTLAFSILEDLAEEIERRKLDDWEAGELLAQPLALLYRCLHKVDAGEEFKQKVYARICRLDPVQALGLSK
jgi:type VI secretion system protein ImpA